MTTVPAVGRKPRFYYGWVIVTVIALAGFSMTAETFPVLGVFLKPITEEFGWSRTVFSGAMSIGTVIGGFLAVGIGPLMDRFGARWTLVVAFTILGATLILLAGIQTLWQFYSLQILGRIMSHGVIGMAVGIVVPKWFLAKRGRAMAMSQMGHRIGNTITPLYVQMLVNVASWRVAAAATGIVMWVVSLLPVALFLRRRPEDMGLLPDGATHEEMQRRHDAVSQTSSRGVARVDVSLTLRQVVRLPSFYFLMVAFALSNTVATGLNLHMISYFTDQGLSSMVSASILALWSGSGVLGSLILGFLADRYGSRRTLAATRVLIGGGFVLLLVANSAALGLLWGFLHGMLSSGVFLQMVILADFYGRDSLGAIRGATMPVTLGANAMGPLVAAVGFELTGSYVLIFAVFGVISVLTSILLLLAQPPVHRSAEPVRSPAQSTASVAH